MEPSAERTSSPKAPCSCIVSTWALKGLQHHNLGAYTIMLGAFGFVLPPQSKGSSKAVRVLKAWGPLQCDRFEVWALTLFLPVYVGLTVCALNVFLVSQGCVRLPDYRSILTAHGLDLRQRACLKMGLCINAASLVVCSSSGVRG